MMEEILPPIPPKKNLNPEFSEPLQMCLNRWILAWLCLIFFQAYTGSSTEGIAVQFLILIYMARRNYWGRAAALFLSGAGSIVFPLFIVQSHNKIDHLTLTLRMIYAAFYIGLFVFLLQKKTKTFFKKKNNYWNLSNADLKWIQIKVRVGALILLIIGVLELLPLEALKRYGFSTGSIFFGGIYLVISCGIFFYRTLRVWQPFSWGCYHRL